MVPCNPDIYRLQTFGCNKRSSTRPPLNNNHVTNEKKPAIIFPRSQR